MYVNLDVLCGFFVDVYGKVYDVFFGYGIVLYFFGKVVFVYD